MHFDIVAQWVIYLFIYLFIFKGYLVINYHIHCHPASRDPFDLDLCSQGSSLS